MEPKEIRLNANKRKSLVTDYRKHEESKHSQEKEDFFDSREKATEAIKSAFATMKEVVERRFKLTDVAILQRIQQDYNTVNAVGFIDKQILPLEDAWYVEYKYGYNLDESNRYHLINKLKGVSRVITKQQAQTPEQQAEEYGSYYTIDTTQARELAITLGLAS